MSLFSALSVSASGMAAQRTRAELRVENLASRKQLARWTAFRTAAKTWCSREWSATRDKEQEEMTVELYLAKRAPATDR